MKVHVNWMNLMKNQIIQKCQNFENLKERVVKQKIFILFYHLTKKYVQWAKKCLALGVDHMCRK
jgi:hypothetical protein